MGTRIVRAGRKLAISDSFRLLHEIPLIPDFDAPQRGGCH